MKYLGFILLFAFLNFSYQVNSQVDPSIDAPFMTMDKLVEKEVGTEEENEREILKENGIESCQCFLSKFKNTAQWRRLIKSYKYDEEGLLIEEYISEDMPDNSTAYFVKYQYDGKGKLNGHEVYIKKNNKLAGTAEYTYTPKARLGAYLRRYPNGGVLEKQAFRYDSLGRVNLKKYCLKTSILGKNQFFDKECAEMLFHYDEEGYLVKISVRGGAKWMPFVGSVPTSDLRAEVIYEYNPDGFLLEEKTISHPQRNVTDRLIYRYEDGQLQSMMKYYDTELKEYYMYAYYPDGKLREERLFNPKKKLKEMTRYEYNDFGFLHKVSKYDRKERLKETYECVYE